MSQTVHLFSSLWIPNDRLCWTGSLCLLSLNFNTLCLISHETFYSSIVQIWKLAFRLYGSGSSWSCYFSVFTAIRQSRLFSIWLVVVFVCCCCFFVSTIVLFRGYSLLLINSMKYLLDITVVSVYKWNQQKALIKEVRIRDWNHTVMDGHM